MATYVKKTSLRVKDELGNLYIIHPETSAANLIGPVPVSGGGTNAETPEAARENLGAAAKDHEHTTAQVTGLDAALADKAAATRQIPVTIPVSAWSTGDAPYTATVDVEGLAADPKGIVGLASNATPEEREAMRNAILSPVSPGTAGELTLVADGDRPGIDLPVVITLWG